MFYVYVYLDPRKSGKFSYKTVSFLYEPIYIGKGKDRRYLIHLKLLKNKQKSHFKNKLLRILLESSKEEIEKHILILRSNLTEQEAFNLEIQLIKEIGRFELKQGPLTNGTFGGEGGSGTIHSKESRKKISRANLGRKCSEETKEKISQANLGKKRSKEVKEKLSQSRIGRFGPNLGRKFSEEVKEKNRQAHLGKTASAETRKKLSQIRLGKPREKPGSMLGKKHSEEAKRKMSQARIGKRVGAKNPMFGRKHSDETKRKMSQTKLEKKLKFESSP